MGQSWIFEKITLTKACTNQPKERQREGINQKKLRIKQEKLKNTKKFQKNHDDKL